jgi:3D (Asp-Asp-Asp) domain-containing protein
MKFMEYNRKYKSTIKRLLMFGGMQVVVALVWLALFQALRSPAERYEDSDGQNAAAAQELNNSPRASKSPIALYEIKSQTIREVSAYNTGDINQGSGDPCISATGENICRALDKGYSRCAANFVPFGTELLLESLDKSWRFQCVVVDRMNKCYRNRVDIAMKEDEKPKAIKFGVQELQVSILEEK